MTRRMLPVFSVLLAHLALLINTRFTLWPEMVVYPYLVNNGFSLYKDLINPYQPLFTVFLSLFSKVFGYQPVPYQLLTWFLILITDLSVFYLTKKIFKNNSYAFFSTIFFAVVSTAFSINGLWFDLVQTPLILFSFFFFQKFLKNEKTGDLFILAILLSITFFIKQQAVWFAAFLVFTLFRNFGKKTIKILTKNSIIFLPCVCIFLSTVLLMQKAGILSDYLFWAFYFPFVKASQMPGYILLPTLRQTATVICLVLTFIPIFFKGSSQSRLIVTAAVVLLMFAYPRFDYFHLIPALALFSVIIGENILIYKKISPVLKSITAFSIIFIMLFSVRYISLNWTKEVRFFERDIMEVSQNVAVLAKSGSVVYIQNGPDQILPLSGILPTKPWADDFPWYFENNNLQGKVLDGLTQENPSYVVSKPYDEGDKFALGVYKQEAIAQYIETHYKNSVQISPTLWLKKRI